MKTFLLCFFALLPLAARERIETLVWDRGTPSTTLYEVFLGLDKIASVTTNQAKITIPFGECVVMVRAINSEGTVSGFSEPLTIPSVASEIRGTFLFSEDLTNWNPNLMTVTGNQVPTQSGKLFLKFAMKPLR